jgi:2-phospho-L-lactate guanylyltransferase (CobY/MobA/RfbA family)
VPVGVDGGVAAAVEARLRELGSERARRRTARALRDAIVDAARVRSSNPLVLASHTVVLGKGTARALLLERDLAVRIAAALAQADADPRAVLAVRSLLYPRPDAIVAAPEKQEQLAHKELGRAAHLLGIAAR